MKKELKRYAIGKAYVVDRAAILCFLRKRRKPGREEAERQQRVIDTLAEFCQQVPDPAGIRIRPIRGVNKAMLETTFAGWPAGIEFAPGRLTINFDETNELLQKLFELSHAMLNDLESFLPHVSRHNPRRKKQSTMSRLPGENPNRREASGTVDSVLPSRESAFPYTSKWETAAAHESEEERGLLAIIECSIYAFPEPISLFRLARSVNEPKERVAGLVERLARSYDERGSGLMVREIAGGYQIATRPEYRNRLDAILEASHPTPLSLPALETLAIIAHKQPIHAEEILKTREVKGKAVIKTLLRRKLIAPAGRNGRQILYKTTKRFLLDFGLKDLSELPSMEEFKQAARFQLDPA
jgi:segregation and condensation protein B